MYQEAIDALSRLGHSADPSYPLDAKLKEAETYNRHNATILKALQLAAAIEAAMAPSVNVHHVGPLMGFSGTLQGT